MSVYSKSKQCSIYLFSFSYNIFQRNKSSDIFRANAIYYFSYIKKKSKKSLDLKEKVMAFRNHRFRTTEAAEEVPNVVELRRPMVANRARNM